MITQLVLTKKEAELLQELLESDRRRMLPEIRRTDTRAMRDELNRRLRTVERLIERLQHPEDEPEPEEVNAGRDGRQAQSPPAI